MLDRIVDEIGDGIEDQVAPPTGTGSLFRDHASVATITMSGSLRTDGTNALGPGFGEINMAASLPLSVIGATDVDPSQSVWRPRPAPAAVVGGIGLGHTNANECKAMMAVMEESALMGKSCMRKMRTREADPTASEADAAACETHAAGTHAAAHVTKMHSTSMHAATTMTATAAMVATTTASEHG